MKYPYVLYIVVVDCGRPTVSVNVSVTYTFTLFNARLTLMCGDGLVPAGVSIAQCVSNGSWIPDPADFTCNSATLAYGQGSGN